MTSIFEQLGGTYTQGSDGMLYPNLSLGDREQRLIDRWGRMHRAYLETEHPCLYDRLILNGTLDRHLADAEERAQANHIYQNIQQAIPQLSDFCLSILQRDNKNTEYNK